MHVAASQPAGRSATAPANAMRPSFAATAPFSITPSPGRPAPSVARRASRQMVSKRIFVLSSCRMSRRSATFSAARYKDVGARDNRAFTRLRRATPGMMKRQAVSDRSFYFDRALLSSGWASDVRLDVANGRIADITPNGARADAEYIAGFAIPGLPNLHCHAFQRGMAGRAERRGPAHDSFWTWREVMYGFLSELTPDHAEAIAAFAYMQMLEAGFTAGGGIHQPPPHNHRRANPPLRAE